MRWMLDTNTASFVIRHRPTLVKRRFDAVAHGNLAISVVVLAELLNATEAQPIRGGDIWAVRLDLTDL